MFLIVYILVCFSNVGNFGVPKTQLIKKKSFSMVCHWLNFANFANRTINKDVLAF